MGGSSPRSFLPPSSFLPFFLMKREEGRWIEIMSSRKRVGYYTPRSVLPPLLLSRPRFSLIFRLPRASLLPSLFPAIPSLSFLLPSILFNKEGEEKDERKESGQEKGGLFHISFRPSSLPSYQPSFLIHFSSSPCLSLFPSLSPEKNRRSEEKPREPRKEGTRESQEEPE